MPSTTLANSYITRLRSAAAKVDAQEVMNIWREAGKNGALDVGDIIKIHRADGISDIIINASQVCRRIKVQHLDPCTELLELSQLSKGALVELCRIRSVAGYSKLNRGQLIELLSA